MRSSADEAWAASGLGRLRIGGQNPGEIGTGRNKELEASRASKQAV